MMPRMTGIEVCLEMRKDPDLTDIPVLFLTAKAQESDVQRGFAAGGNDYVVKPFSPRELSTRIDALLARAPR
jgi:two-component system phosphate regulon response regulator PhoB